MKNPKNSRIINVDYLARVEGEGGLSLKIKAGNLQEVQFKIFEPPRFFEAFLEGRDYREVPDITSRICGICPVAYQTSSLNALEDGLGVKVEGALADLRRMLYCGEWIESHTLHIAMLHAPDFLGYQDSIAMARDHEALVKKALRLKKIGNAVMSFLGGRSIHPVNSRVGGFYRVPSAGEMNGLKADLKWALAAARDLVAFTGSLKFPDFERDYEFVALSHPSEYAIQRGTLVSSKGLKVEAHGWEKVFEERQAPYTNALHCVIKLRPSQEGRSYLTGPLARYNLNQAQLSPLAKKAARAAGLKAQCRNPFKSIIVRAVEVLYAVEEILKIISGYREPGRPFVEAAPKAGRGCGYSEAPRGLLYHRYDLDSGGKVLQARIVPPTAQNQLTIEEDLKALLPGWMNLSDEKLKWKCEQAVRNYDPCISCSVHFLNVTIQRQPS